MLSLLQQIVDAFGVLGLVFVGVASEDLEVDAILSHEAVFAKVSN